ncbi:hypothetical protein [Mycobacterium talmoniae]|uniref:hypothetical protein n=1 Tax=Mycobacterium talmoniae TaxID=1858794 RepID=UPI000AB4825D|nr:hypothetical protein [Mycobacterium talmoniae]
MTVDGLLAQLDGLLGRGRVATGSAAPMVRQLAPPAAPANWSSPAADDLVGRNNRLSGNGAVFAASDDDAKAKLDDAGAQVGHGKNQMGVIREDYRRNRDRMAPAASNPEVAARMAELDRQRASDGATTVRNAVGRMPQIGGNPAMGSLAQMMPAAAAPMAAMAPALSAPLQAFSQIPALMGPAASMLTLPHTVTHNGTPHDNDTTLANFSGRGGSVRDAIDQALDIKGITDPQARADWAAGMITVADRESNGNVNAINNSDANAAKGTPSAGAFQFIEPTFRAYHEPGTSTVLNDPVAQAAAFINYAMGRYHVSADGHDLAAKIQQADPTRPPHGY